MARAYYASKLSEHISKTPEGFIIATDTVVGRDGFQRYSVRDLPQERAAELGVNIENSNAYVDLYRPSEEVFSKECLASFEGKVLTSDHPSEFVDPTNFKRYTCGHIQNVRKGWEALESGDWPIIADLIISDQTLIDRVMSGTRDISLGYDYTLAAEGNKLLMTDIRGNHAAIVWQGRAGPEARIVDAATESTEAVKPVLETKSEAVKPDVRPQIKQKEFPVTNVLKNLLGRGLKALAADENIDPEKLAEAAAAAHRATDEESKEEEEKKREKDAADKRMRDAEEEKKKKEEDSKRMKDAEEEKERKEKSEKDAKDAADKKMKDEAEEKEKKEKEAKDAADKAAKDAAAKGEHFKLCTDKNCSARDCRMHDALHGILKDRPESEDADVEELRKIMSEFGGGEGEHDAAEMGSEVIEPIPAAHDESEAEMEKKKEGDGKAADAAAADKALDAELFALLKEMRPAVAQTGSQAAKDRFNAQFRRFNRASKASIGDYGKFAGAAGTGTAGKSRDRGASGANDAEAKAKLNEDMTAAYAAILHGDKEVTK